MDLVLNFGLPLIVGIAGWFVAHFVAKPLLELQRLRQEVSENLTRYANVEPLSDLLTERPRYDEAIAAFRTLGSKVYALQNSSVPPASWLLSLFDLNLAASGLLGLSNEFGQPLDGQRAIRKHQVQKGLRLPRRLTDQQAETVKKKLTQRPARRD